MEAPEKTQASSQWSRKRSYLSRRSCSLGLDRTATFLCSRSSPRSSWSRPTPPRKTPPQEPKVPAAVTKLYESFTGIQHPIMPSRTRSGPHGGMAGDSGGEEIAAGRARKRAIRYTSGNTISLPRRFVERIAIP